MQNTINAFLDGITTDLHPLTMPETAMTSALNATILTGNGNEQILLNDMGNTLIKDSITGSIMSLSDGFIPLGMKEHGGILYIASHNPQTGEGELGSIPSPIIHYTVEGEQIGSVNATKISDLGDAPVVNELSISTDDIASRVNTNTLIILNDKIFHCGDKFIVLLDLSGEFDGLDVITKKYSEKYPLVSGFYYDSDNPTEPGTGSNISLFTPSRGWFRVELYAVDSTGKEIRLDKIESTPQRYYRSDGSVYGSNYWFLETQDGNIDIDITRTRTTDMFRTYPNIPAGRLAIKFLIEYPEDLLFVYNASFQANVPQVYIDKSDRNNYKKYVIIPGFIYKADCPILPDLIKVTCECNGAPIEVKAIQQSNSISKWSNTVPENIVITNNTFPVDFQELILSTATTKTFPYSDRGIQYTGNYRYGLGVGFVKSVEELYYITKYRQSGDNYIDNPVRNYSEKDHDGLFYIEVDNLNSDLIFTLELYTISKTNKDVIPSNKDLSKYPYVLYKKLQMPVFNPALFLLGGSGQLNIDINTRQYLDITKSAEDTFDIQLFKGY